MILNSISDKSLFGEDEWYFFTPRDRKYPNGVRPNRTAASGFWKATGTDKPILSASGSRRIGVKKALVFYTGRPPKGVKTDWIMTEYRLPDTTTRPSRFKGSMRVRNYVFAYKISLFTCFLVKIDEADLIIYDIFCISTHIYKENLTLMKTRRY